MRSTPKSFYNSKEWKRVRQDYLLSQQCLCERCRAKGLIVPAEIVHHKIYLDESNYRDPSISLNFENLEALCLDCHNKEHFKAKEYEKRWSFGPNGLEIKAPLGQNEAL